VIIASRRGLGCSMIVVDLSARATTIHHDHGFRAERPHSITSRRGAGLAELPTADLAVDADDGRSPDEATSRPSKRTPSRRYGSIWRGSRVRGDALRLMPNWQICLQQPSLVLAGRSAEIGGRWESGPCRPVPVGGRARGYSPDVFPQSGGERPDQPLRAAGQHMRERQSRSRTPVMACVNVSSCRRSSSSAAAGFWWRATCLSPSGPPPCHCRSGGPAYGSTGRFPVDIQSRRSGGG